MKTFPKPRDRVVHRYMTREQQERNMHLPSRTMRRDEFLQRFRVAWVKYSEKSHLVCAMATYLIGSARTIRYLRPEDLIGSDLVHIKNYESGTGFVMKIPTALYKLLDLYFKRYYKHDSPFPLNPTSFAGMTKRVWGCTPQQLATMEVL